MPEPTSVHRRQIPDSQGAVAYSFGVYHPGQSEDEPSFYIPSLPVYRAAPVSQPQEPESLPCKPSLPHSSSYFHRNSCVGFKHSASSAFSRYQRENKKRDNSRLREESDDEETQYKRLQAPKSSFLRNLKSRISNRTASTQKSVTKATQQEFTRFTLRDEEKRYEEILNRHRVKWLTGSNERTHSAPERSSVLRKSSENTRNFLRDSAEKSSRNQSKAASAAQDLLSTLSRSHSQRDRVVCFQGKLASSEERDAKWYHTAPVLRNKNNGSHSKSSSSSSSSDSGRKLSWRDTLNDIIERQTARTKARRDRMSQGDNDVFNDDFQSPDSPKSARMYRSVLTLGSVGSRHSSQERSPDREDKVKVRLKSDGEDIFEHTRLRRPVYKTEDSGFGNSKAGGSPRRHNYENTWKRIHSTDDQMNGNSCQRDQSNERVDNLDQSITTNNKNIEVTELRDKNSNICPSHVTGDAEGRQSSGVGFYRDRISKLRLNLDKLDAKFKSRTLSRATMTTADADEGKNRGSVGKSAIKSNKGRTEAISSEAITDGIGDQSSVQISADKSGEHCAGMSVNGAADTPEPKHLTNQIQETGSHGNKRKLQVTTPESPMFVSKTISRDRLKSSPSDDDDRLITRSTARQDIVTRIKQQRLQLLQNIETHEGDEPKPGHHPCINSPKQHGSTGDIRELVNDLDMEEMMLKTPEQVDDKIDYLQDELKQNSDFGERRKIRAKIRSLREKRLSLDKDSGSPVSEFIRTKGDYPVSREATPVKDVYALSCEGYNGVTGIPELRRLLSEETDYDEKRKIRTALRHLRQREKEKESGTLPLNGRGLTRSQSHIERRSAVDSKPPVLLRRQPNLGKVSDRPVLNGHSVLNGHVSIDREQEEETPPTFSLVRRDSGSWISSHSSSLNRYNSGNSSPSPDQETISKSSDRGSKVFTSSHTINICSNHRNTNRDRDSPQHSSGHTPQGSSQTSSSTSDDFPCSSLTSEDVERLSQSAIGLKKNRETGHVTPKVKSPSERLSGLYVGIPKSSTSTIPKTSPNLDAAKNSEASSPTRRFSFSSSERCTESFERERTSNVDDNCDDVSGKDWIEQKKRSNSLPCVKRKFSAVEMEAAFSELLSAVDQRQDSVTDDYEESADLLQDDGSSHVRGKSGELTSLGTAQDDSGEVAYYANSRMQTDSETNVNDVVKSEVTASCLKSNDFSLGNDLNDSTGVSKDKTNIVNNDNISSTKCHLNSDVIEQNHMIKPTNQNATQESHEEEEEEEVEVVTYEEVKVPAMPNDNTKENADSNKELVVSPPRPLREPRSVLALNIPEVPVPDKNYSSSIIDGDDGSVTIQTTTRQDLGEHVVTEKTKLRRTESNSQMEEKDTVVERKVASPGGTSQYQKDIISSRRKITNRGSDYYSRSKYVIKRTRKDSDEIEELDVTLETDNFSATKGQSWGHRAEASVELVNTGDRMLTEPVANGNHLLEVTNQSGTGSKTMNISKTSSGYGSVSGSDEEETTVAVQQGRPSGCPEITTTLNSVEVTEGETAVLECTVVSSPLPTMSWYRGGSILERTARFEPKFEGSTGKATLTVKKTTAEDKGEYKCVFRNPLGQAETTGKLTVKTKAGKKPIFKNKLREQTVTEGLSVTLECTVADATSVAWYKDGIVQRNSSDFKQTFDGTTAKLEISEIFLDDKGEYSCVAKNDCGESKTSCKIFVKECESEDNIAPIFVSKPASQILTGGDLFTLECDVIGTPRPVVSWFKDSNKVTAVEGMSESFDGRVACLTIQKCAVQNSGKYECIAQNGVGTASTDALVVVKAKQGAPVVVRGLTDATVTCGDPLTLRCEVSGYPVPTVLWRKEGRVIGNTRDFTQSYENSVASLTIKEVLLQDSGCYDCVARNSHGITTTTCQLQVQNNTKADGLEKPSGTGQVSSKLDWLVGRGKDPSFEPDPKMGPRVSSLLSSVRRSESMRAVAEGGSRERFLKKLQEEKPQKPEELDLKPSRDRRKVLPPTPTALSSLSSSSASSASPEKEEAKTDMKEKVLKIVPSVGETEKKGVESESKTDAHSSKVEEQAEKNERKSPVPAPRRINYEKLPPKEEPKEPAWKNIQLRRTASARVSSANRPFVTKRASEEGQIKTTFTEKGIANQVKPNLTPNLTDRILVNQVTPGKANEKGKKEKTKDEEKAKDSDRMRLSPKPDETKTQVDTSAVTSGLPSWLRQKIEAKKTSPSSSSSSPTTTTQAVSRVASTPSVSSTVVTSTAAASSTSSSSSSVTTSVTMTTRVSPEPSPVSSTVATVLSSSSVSPPTSTVSSSSPAITSTSSLALAEEPVRVRNKSPFDPTRPQTRRWKTLTGNHEREAIEIALSRAKGSEPSRAPPALQRSESAQHVPRNDILARAISNAMEKSRTQEVNNNSVVKATTMPQEVAKTSPGDITLTSHSKVKTPDIFVTTDQSEASTDHREKPTEVKLTRTQSARLMFERKCNEEKQQSGTQDKSPLASFLARKEGAVRRTSSLKVTPSEKQAGWFQSKQQQESSPLVKKEDTAMPSYETIDDEEELHKILSNTDNFEERKKIRARMKEIREKKMKESEARRLQREKETEDLVKRKYQLAEEQKKKKLEQFAKDAKTASAERDKLHKASDDLLKDKIRQADEDKKRHLEVFDKLARHEDTKTKSTSSTVTKTEQIPGGIRTTVVSKTESTSRSGGFGTSYGSAEQAAKYLADQLKHASSCSTEGRITVTTESWSSVDGNTHSSQKTETWGRGKAPEKPGNVFKQMDAAAPKPANFLAPGGGAGRGRGVTRSPSAIKQMLLDWCKAMTKEYEQYGVSITNFSNSWNDGMAFCALIHHFYPESFDFSKLNPKARRANFTLAFDTAEKYADIAPLLEVDDMVRMKTPDWKCVFTYVQSFYRKLQLNPANKANQPAEQ